MTPLPSRIPAFVASLAVAAVVIVAPVSASAEPIGTVEQVSTFSPTQTHTGGGQSSIATNPTSGVTLAAWAGPTALPSASVNVSVIGAGGAVGPVATLQPDASRPLASPSSRNPLSIDAGPGGGFIITWAHEDDSAIFGVLVDSAGAFIGTEFAISSNTDYADIETVSAAWSEADSRYLVTWKARASSTLSPLWMQQIIGRFIDGSGVGIGGDFLVTTLSSQIDNSQDLAFGAGRWVSVGVGAIDGIVYATTVTAAGGASASVALTSGAFSSGASVDFNATTQQFLVVSRASGNLSGQLLDSTGVPVGSAFFIAAGSGSRPRVASLHADGWLVVWHNGSNGDTREILGIEVSAAGAPVGAAEAVSSGADNAAVELNFRPEVSFSAATGEAYVVWTRHLTVAGETNVAARAWAVTAPAVVTPAPAAAPTLPAAGPDTDRIMVLAGAGVLILALGALMLRRRRVLDAV